MSLIGSWNLMSNRSSFKAHSAIYSAVNLGKLLNLSKLELAKIKVQFMSFA